MIVLIRNRGVSYFRLVIFHGVFKVLALVRGCGVYLVELCTQVTHLHVQGE